MKKITAFVLAIVLSLSGFALFAGAFVDGANLDYDTGTFNAADYTTKYVLAKQVWKNEYGTETTTYTYNKAGLLTKSSYTGMYDDYYTESFTYDADFRVTKWKYGSIFCDESSAVAYNKKGNAVKITNQTVDGEYDVVYSYNSKGLVSKKETKCEWAPSTTVYSYNSSGKLIKEVSTFDGTTTTYTYTYNKDGRLSKSTQKYSYGTYETLYKYNSKGKLISEANAGSGYTSKTTYKYDSKGRLTQEKSEDGNYVVTKTYTYNSKGLLTKKTQKSTDGIIYTYTYAYDSHGNLIKQTRKEGSSTTTVTYTYKKISASLVKIGRVTVQYASAVYSGKAKKPAVYVEGAVQGADYRVIYSNCTNPGKATLTIRFTDPAKGEIKVKYTVKPRQVTGLKAAEVKTDSIKVTWTKRAEAKAYKVEYSADGKTWKSATVTANAYTLKNLKAGSKWQFRVKALDSSKTIAGKPSAVLSVTTKK